MAGGKRVGDRVGVVLGRDGETGEVRFLGFGVYVGDERPAAPIGFVRTAGSTWEEVDAHYRELGFSEGLPDWTNPKLLLDSGVVVWGAEVWWGPEKAVQRHLDAWREQGETIVLADIRDTRREAGYQLPDDTPTTPAA